MSIITLTTDLGTRSLCKTEEKEKFIAKSRINIVDISNDISKFDIQEFLPHI